MGQKKYTLDFPEKGEITKMIKLLPEHLKAMRSFLVGSKSGLNHFECAKLLDTVAELEAELAALKADLTDAEKQRDRLFLKVEEGGREMIALDRQIAKLKEKNRLEVDRAVLAEHGSSCSICLNGETCERFNKLHSDAANRAKVEEKKNGKKS